MSFQIVDSVEQANAITHAGTFHADEVLASVVLSHCMQVKLARVFQVPEDLPRGILVYDIGLGKYDHHQMKKATRGNGLPYAAFGLIWRDYGKRFLLLLGCPELFLNRVFTAVDKKFVTGIDAYDNGVTITEGQGIEKAVSLIVGLFNPTWYEETTADEAFTKAVEVADEAFCRMVINLIAGVKAEDAIDQAIKVSKNHVLVLDKYLPWKGALLNSKQTKAEDIWFVIYPSNRGGYSCQCVPLTPDSFEQRRSIPEKWKGNPEATGIEDCLFVHRTGFLSTFKSLEGAKRFAALVIQEEVKEG